MLEVLGIQNAQKLVPMEDDERTKDPISENIAAVKGKPMKAFIFQDHDAHIMAHQSFMMDPLVMKTIGQNPQASMIMAALQAHIAEHLGFQYRAQVEQQMGVPIPAPDQKLPDEVEVQLSRLIAQASQQLLRKHEGEAAQQQAQQQAMDPLVQIQQAQLKIEQDDAKRKAAKDSADIALKQEQIKIEKARILAQQETEKLRIKADLIKSQSSEKNKESLGKKKMMVDAVLTQAKLNKGSQ